MRPSICPAATPFADATDAFFERFATLMDEATSGQVELVRPLAKLDKGDVMSLARGYPLERTFSCLAPRGLVHCGRCNNSAFAEAGIVDPTKYAEPPALAAVAGLLPREVDLLDQTNPPRKQRFVS
jgi:7-cyano-7-deazaguanine synthase in queuosine biosynthesis